MSSSASLAPQPEAGADAEPKLAPLTGEPVIALAVEGFGEAVVSVPVGAAQPRPVVIALHGNFDRPEWQCQAWRGITRGYPFVLCPRGVSRKDSPQDAERFTYEGFRQTEKEMRAGLSALKARFAAHVAAGPVVLAGFSLGANQAVVILRQEPAFFSRVALIEGGTDKWSAGIASVFARGGGERVLFVCSQKGCQGTLESRVTLTRRAGADARAVFAGNVGHTYDGQVAEAVGREFGWLVAGDPRYRDH